MKFIISKNQLFGIFSESKNKMINENRFLIRRGFANVMTPEYLLPLTRKNCFNKNPEDYYGEFDFVDAVVEESVDNILDEKMISPSQDDYYDVFNLLFYHIKDICEVSIIRFYKNYMEN
jgi:hypothetical protein